jgi:hypothetical protein
LAGCKKFLEFEPENFILEEDAIKTGADLQLLMNATYDVARSANFLGGSAYLLSDLMADDINGDNLTGDWGAYYDRNTGIFNQSTRNVWQEGYITIGRCNKVLESFDIVSDLSADDRTRLEAEARFLRAVGHFYLVRFFGQPYGYTADNSHLGIPVRLSYTIETYGRNTVAEVYAQVLADLNFAKDNLPTSNNGYATSWSAKGMLAKVYFQMNDFQNAFDQANDVISNGPFSLAATPSGRYAQGGSTEGVFELQSTGTADFSGRGLQGYYRTDAGVDPTIRMASALYGLAIADTADWRQRWFTLRDQGQSTERIFLTRFDSLPYFNMPVISLTELALIRGEAAAELGNTGVATTDLNAIRMRAGLSEILGADAATLITFIRAERRLEMVGEGVRLSELKRQAVRGNTSLQIRGSIWNCPGMVVQFPDSETRGNPSFQLNEEGGC